MNPHRSSIMGLALLAAAAVPTLSAADISAPVQASEVKWGPAPPIMPKGAELAVLAGDPSKAGHVTLRLKMPKNYDFPAHWHPTDERVTVISGEFGLGMGDKLDRKASKVLKAGGYAIAPAHMNHYAWTKTGAVVQVDLMGPFALTYVNPADDPTRK